MFIVKWYQEIMEEGLDTRQILKYYRASKAKIEDLHKQVEKEKAKAAKSIEKVQDKLKET